MAVASRGSRRRAVDGAPCARRAACRTSDLREIYFNGDGVARNRALAKRYACVMRGDEDAQPLLDRLDAAASAGTRLDACDAADDFNAFNVCDILHEDLQRRAARKQESDLVTRWDAARRDAFAPLKKASDAYIAARTPLDSVKMRGGSTTRRFSKANSSPC